MGVVQKRETARGVTDLEQMKIYVKLYKPGEFVFTQVKAVASPADPDFRRIQ